MEQVAHHVGLGYQTGCGDGIAYSSRFGPRHRVDVLLAIPLRFRVPEKNKERKKKEERRNKK